ncbi:MAG TPA: molybdopterin molybdotransferase MoeA [Thiolinea sp.]|nr:molybdopterin molybdotransferase MoeA [Thiolinea sp.]
MQANLSCDVLPASILTVEQAQERILSSVQAITATESVSLLAGCSRILATDVYAGFDVPPHRNSSMDGYAFAQASLTKATSLKQVGIAWAGRPYLDQVELGKCVRIMTGACLPEGTDTVVMQENTRQQALQITLQTPTQLGENVRYPGDDFKQGELLLEAGRKLTAADLGLLASLGLTQVQVLRKPKIAICSTGDELRPLGSTLQAGDIYDTNRYTLHALLQALNVEVLDLGIIPDQPAAIEQAFLHASQQADVLITTGGVSVGDADFVTSTLQKLGEVNIWKIAMKPGKPLAQGKLGECLFFGLPGNPVSTMATFLIFVRPAILKLAGANTAQPITQLATTLTDLKKTPGRKDYQRGIYTLTSNGLQVRSTGKQDSHLLRSMSQANCFIVLEREWGDMAAGSQVSILPFDQLF